MTTHYRVMIVVDVLAFSMADAIREVEQIRPALAERGGVDIYACRVDSCQYSPHEKPGA